MILISFLLMNMGFASSDKASEKDNLQDISRCQDVSRKLSRVKKIQMGFRRPQKEDGVTFVRARSARGNKINVSRAKRTKRQIIVLVPDQT